MAPDPGSLHVHPRETRCDSEQDRIRDLSRYYCTFEQDPSSNSPSLSPDTTLTALTKLGVYRFGCNRSFVSIIDDHQQHLISEATASVSLCNPNNHSKDDGIYLGVRTLDLEWGVCPHAIRLFTGQDTSRVRDTENITANRTRNIIRDFTLDDFYKDRPYVQEWPYFRFYAEVPLYSPSGYVLGSYCVVDNKPRTEFGDEDVAALQEIADSISKHLENVRVVQYHRRAEDLVKGLTSFVKGQAQSDSTNPSNHLSRSREALSFQNLNFPKSGIQASDTNISTPSKPFGDKLGAGQSSSATLEEGEPSLFSEAKDSEITRPTSQPSSLALDSPELAEVTGLEEYFSGPPLDEVPVTEQVAAIFSRARDLLKSSMNLDGVVFLDASQTDSKFDFSEDFESDFSFSGYEKSETVVKNIMERPERLCRSLDHSLSLLHASNSGSTLSLPEMVLSALLNDYPGGHIFDMSDKPCDLAKKEQEISHNLARSLPDAMSILFIPLWDWNKSKCLAGTLVWTQDSCRPLGMEELHYFKVFGDSIISEVSRVHWRATERSKFDFVSSINHELRSPLHGILGSAELMQSMPLEPAQQDLAKMIEESGLTLLNTIDHLLEYCKINDLPTAKSDCHEILGRSIRQVSDFDLANLVEEATTVLCTGQRTPSMSIHADRANVTSPAIEIGQGQPNSSDEVSVVVRIEHLDSWMVRSVSSAWKRILMNLLDNAMKWTKHGLVEIMLSQTKAEIDGPSFANLCVRDTGIGISREFLKNSLFSAFSQEDSLSPGVGLGLSVVHTLVKSLGGDVDFRSESGVGTQVDIHIPIQWPGKEQTVNEAEHGSSIPRTCGASTQVQACLVGMHGHPELNETPTGILSADAKRKLSIRNALTDVLERQLGWHLPVARSPRLGNGDVAIVEEADLSHMLVEGRLTAANPKSNFKVLIVLDRKTTPLIEDLPSNIIRISQPFGPKSIREAAEKFLQFRDTALQAEFKVSQPTSNDQQTLFPATQQDCDNITGRVSLSLDATSISTERPQSTAHLPKSMHVLIVDDNEINLKIMSTFIRKIGCCYETAINGLLALEKYEGANHPYDFVLMDISMPVMDGLVATRKIREHEKNNGLKPSCILAVTAVASNATQEAAIKAGVNGYLVKPLSFDKFRQLMHIK